MKLDGVFELQENFEGKIHLIKKQNSFLPEIENKLLQIRKKRLQPFVDNKIMTSWNALAGIALVQAGYWLEREDYLIKADRVFAQLLEVNGRKDTIYHSSCDGILQKDEFLEDYASLLLFVTYLHEKSGGYENQINNLRNKLMGFYQDEWKANNNSNFITIPAGSFDHPSPASVSLAEMALLRTAILLNEDYENHEYQQAFMNDFHNLAAFISQGNWHTIHISGEVKRHELPFNSIIISGSRFQDCYRGVCRDFTSREDLINNLI